MVMIELSESEKPRAPPSPSFSAPFASPSLRWACKKRLRCFHPDDAAAALRLSPTRPPPPVHASTASPARRPSPSSRARILIRLPSPGSGDDYRGEAPMGAAAAAPDLSTPDAGSGEGRGKEEVPRRGSDEVGMGWSLRSAARQGEGEGQKKRRRVELWVSLSRDEIDEDFLWMTGAKPPRRSRRRDRGALDHFLMGVFPGSWMPNRISAARYRVAEPSEPRKD